MLKKIRMAMLFSVSCLIIACGYTKDKPVAINFSKDRSEIEITNINEAGIFQLKKNLATDSAYQRLVTVLQTPGENDSTTMEMELQGKLRMSGEKLVFKPDMPFIKGNSYLIETILNTQFASGEDIIKSDVGYKVKQQTKTLVR